jgi:lysophospholipase L1-like esterase
MSHRAKHFGAVLLLAVCGSKVFAATETHWVGTWACAPTAQAKSDTTNYGNTTIRDIVHVSLGGKSARLKISNQLGTAPLLIGATHLAISAREGKEVSGTDHRVTFGGLESFIIPAGAMAISDPVDLAVPALSDLAVSIYVPQQTLPLLTEHALGSSWTYHAEGNQSAALEMPKAMRTRSWMLLTGIDVNAPAVSSTVVALGDSITDGAHSTPNENLRWPDILSSRLHAAMQTASVGVVNEGISGNRILHDVAGTNALARLDRDVFSQSGAKYLVVLESINDIRYATHPRTPEDVVTAEQLIWAMQQIVVRGHAHGLKIYGATLTPYGGSRDADPVGEQMRVTINNWIRTSGIFDAVIDFDKATRDPIHPDAFRESYDSGDHLHPSDAGYKAMADSIDLALFH